MNVAFDTGPLTSGDSVRGVGAYTRELLNELEKQTKKVKELTISRVSSDEIQLKSNKFDIVHIPYFNPYFLTVPKLQAKVVVTIHDVIPLIYPRHYPSGIKGKIKLETQKRRLRNVGAVITDSESSKKDIVRFLDVPQEKIHVIYLAASDRFRRLAHEDSTIVDTKIKYNLPKKFVLYMGDVNFNKNIPTLIKACLKEKLTLVIVGKQADIVKTGADDLRNVKGPKDWYRYLVNKPHPEQAHYSELRDLLNKPNILCLGFLPDQEQVSLYNLATVYCQPSYVEGFGLPVVESLMCGTQVLTSRTQALVEIGGRYTTHFDPYSVTDLSSKLRKLINHPRSIKDIDISNLGNLYSWNKTARKTIEVYRNLYAR